MRTLYCCLWLGVMCSPAWALQAAAAQPKVEDLLDQVDRLYRADDSYAEVDMTIVNPDWQRTLSLAIWSQGLQKTFIRILAPAKDRGVATLRDGKEMWNYFPKIDKVMKVPPSMMMGSWMGSDFTNDDLVKETTLLQDYHARLLESGPGQEGRYVIELVPKSGTASVWGKIILTVARDSLLPVREEYYDEKGRKLRLLEFSEVKTMGSRTLPTVMSIMPLNKPGNKTVIEYKKAVFNQGVSNEIFSLRNLQKKL